MNNQEYLIQILLKLRSIGIKNDKVLGAIEKIPPHFYYNLFNPSKDIKKINIDEVNGKKKFSLITPIKKEKTKS